MKKVSRIVPISRLISLLIIVSLLVGFPIIGQAKSDRQIPPPSGNVDEQAVNHSVTILVDDFKPQHDQWNSTYDYDRFDSGRGVLNYSKLTWGNGQVKATISSGNFWGGIWFCLNHSSGECLPINFSAILPKQVTSTYQSHITGINVEIAKGTPGRTFRVELIDHGNKRWSSEIILTGGKQTISRNLPVLGNINQIVVVLDHAVPGDYVILTKISLTASTKITDPARAAFVWSYGMLLNNWNPNSGLVREKAKDPSGTFDSIPATGSLAAATALAKQLGVVNQTNAVKIVNKINSTLIKKIPRFHGLWPHWVKKSSSGEFEIVGPDGYNDVTGKKCSPTPCNDHNGDGINDITHKSCKPEICTDKGTEWSSMDTIIAAIGLLDARAALGLSTSSAEQILRNIDWNAISTPSGISHGYDYTKELINSYLDTFGGESWLAELAYATAKGQVAPMPYPSPPTSNGSGYLDELAWLYVEPPSVPDFWGNDWDAYRAAAADTQMSYYPTYYPTSCFTKLGLFGLSAAEVPDPSIVDVKKIYQDFGIGGRFASPNDGSVLLGAPVVIPSYSAMIASLNSSTAASAIKVWDWLIKKGLFSPLNNVESLMYKPLTNCSSTALRWNQLKGSRNLALQTLGWGIYLAKKQGQVPNVWLAASKNDFLRKAYLRLVPDGLPLGPGLDEDASQWGGYTDGSGIPTWEISNVWDPSLDGRSLRCALTGGDPYSNVHCYRNLPAKPDSNSFKLSMSFFYQPASSYNNVGEPSIAQALEFSMSKWDQDKRYEWALQWDNVDSGGPKWRYWDPNDSSKWLDLGISGSLAGEQWHTLKLEGQIINDQVHYSRFTLDGQIHNLDITVDPASTPGELDRLAIAVQLDGNSTETPYEVFADHVTFSAVTSETYSSIAAQDGSIVESSETSGLGGVLNSTASAFNIGDDKTKKQSLAILSFNTSSLPDNAVITNIMLKVKKQSIVGGGNPVTMFNGFMVDIKKGVFGKVGLQLGDFQAAASKTYGPFKTKPVSGWYTINLTSAKSYINKLSTNGGLTQIRLRFKLDDNNDTVANLLKLYSGNAAAANCPQLMVTYYVP